MHGPHSGAGCGERHRGAVQRGARGRRRARGGGVARVAALAAARPRRVPGPARARAAPAAGPSACPRPSQRQYVTHYTLNLTLYLLNYVTLYTLNLKLYSTT